MARAQYSLERTNTGHQYVIPGTEKQEKAKGVPLPTTEGRQFVLPGAEQITMRELITRQMARPLKPRAAQKALRGTALFY